MSTDQVDFKLTGPETRTQKVTKFEKMIEMTTTAVVVMKNKSKVQEKNRVFNLHTTWEFVCMQINNRIFQHIAQN